VFVPRGVWLYLSALVATSCLVAAAYLAFDWADYGADSTCGNFIRRAPWTGPCSEIMWHRVFGVIGLVIFASAVLLVGLLGWLIGDGTAPDSERREALLDLAAVPHLAAARRHPS
jgi:hypothetical protein